MLSAKRQKLPSAGQGRPPKYGPLPTSREEMYPMQLEEVLHRINYFKGVFCYQHILPFFPEPIGIQVKKPEIIQFITDAYEEARIVFSCYSPDQEMLWVEAIDIEPQTLNHQTRQVERPKHTPIQQNARHVPSTAQASNTLDDYYQTPEANQAPTTRKDTDAAYDADMNPIAVRIAPGQWKMGHLIMRSEGRPIEFKKGYNPLRDEGFVDFHHMQGYAYWDDEEEVWKLWDPRGSIIYPEIPEESVFQALNGLDPMQFQVANTIRRSYTSSKPFESEQTYEEQQTTTVEDIQVQRLYLRRKGKDPDQMGPNFALPKGVRDLPEDWVDPED